MNAAAAQRGYNRSFRRAKQKYELGEYPMESQ